MLRGSWLGNFAAATMRLVCCIALGACLLAAQQAGQPSLILSNGKILTVDPNFSIAQAVAITGNTITAVGSTADVMKLAGPNTQVIDLKGRTVVPGMMDTHFHYSGLEYGGDLSEPERAEYVVDWRGVRSKEDVLTQISGIIAKYKIKPGEWIHFNNRISFMGDGNPTTLLQADILFNQLNRWELDKAAPNNPIIMSEGIPEYNGLLINGVAMDILWKNYGDFIKKNGRIWIDATGRPDGHLDSVATRPIMMKYEPSPTPEILAKLFRMEQEALDSMGETTISGRYPAFRVAALKLLESRGEAIGRTAYGREDDFGLITDPSVDMKKLQGVVGTGSDKVWITSVAPSSVDGSGSRMCTNQKKSGSGAIDGFYPMGQCYQDTEFRGAAGHAGPISKNYFRDWIFASAKYNIRFANTHMSGDRSVAQFLKMVQDAHKQYGANSTKGWASDHCDLVDPADLKQAASLGIQFSCYPNAVNKAAFVAKDFGEKIANTFTSPLKSMVDAGIHPAYEGEGAPHVWSGLGAFITRKDQNGKVWALQEKIDHPTALKMATIWAAEYVLKADKLGSIEKGKLADLVVLDKDYLTMPDDDVAKMQPQVTVFDGKIVFVHSQFAEEYNLRPAGAVVSTYQDLVKRRNGSGGNGG
jgi:predicted amidohydrolase YtcJ